MAAGLLCCCKPYCGLELAVSWLIVVWGRFVGDLWGIVGDCGGMSHVLRITIRQDKMSRYHGRCLRYAWVVSL